MRVAEKLDWKGLKIKKSVGNRKIIMSDFVFSQQITQVVLFLFLFFSFKTVG
jgi:hypothetical protein